MQKISSSARIHLIVMSYLIHIRLRDYGLLYDRYSVWKCGGCERNKSPTVAPQPENHSNRPDSPDRRPKCNGAAGDFVLTLSDDVMFIDCSTNKTDLHDYHEWINGYARLLSSSHDETVAQQTIQRAVNALLTTTQPGPGPGPDPGPVPRTMPIELIESIRHNKSDVMTKITALFCTRGCLEHADSKQVGELEADMKWTAFGQLLISTVIAIFDGVSATPHTVQIPSLESKSKLLQLCRDVALPFIHSCIRCCPGDLNEIRAPNRSLLGVFNDPSRELHVDIAYRLDPSPRIKALELLFSRNRRTKLGYILIEVRSHDGHPSFALRGMAVEPSMRGQGLSKLFFYVWLQLCFKLHVEPTTRRIDKPLISLVLAQNGFEPTSERKAVQVAVSAQPGPAGETVLWGSNTNVMHSTFSNRALKNQHLIIAKEKPAKSRNVYVRACFHHPNINTIRPRVEAKLHGHVEFYSARLLACLYFC
jgi:hypothetical protein